MTKMTDCWRCKSKAIQLCRSVCDALLWPQKILCPQFLLVILSCWLERLHLVMAFHSYLPRGPSVSGLFNHIWRLWLLLIICNQDQGRQSPKRTKEEQDQLAYYDWLIHVLFAYLATSNFPLWVFPRRHPHKLSTLGFRDLPTQKKYVDRLINLIFNIYFFS